MKWRRGPNPASRWRFLCTNGSEGRQVDSVYENKAKRRKSADERCREGAVQLALRIEGGESALKRADELVATAVNRMAGSAESGNESSNGRHSCAKRTRLSSKRSGRCSASISLQALLLGARNEVSCWVVSSLSLRVEKSI